MNILNQIVLLNVGHDRSYWINSPDSGVVTNITNAKDLIKYCFDFMDKEIIIPMQFINGGYGYISYWDVFISSLFLGFFIWTLKKLINVVSNFDIFGG